METLTGFGIYLLICAGIFGVIFLISWLKGKFNIKDEEIDLAHNVIELVVYLAQKSGFKCSGDIAVVARYVFLAIEITEEFEDTDTIEEKKQLISEEAIAICEENGVNVDAELIGLINEIVDYFVK